MNGSDASNREGYRGPRTRAMPTFMRRFAARAPRRGARRSETRRSVTVIGECDAVKTERSDVGGPCLAWTHEAETSVKRASRFYTTKFVAILVSSQLHIRPRWIRWGHSQLHADQGSQSYMCIYILGYIGGSHR